MENYGRNTMGVVKKNQSDGVLKALFVRFVDRPKTIGNLSHLFQLTHYSVDWVFWATKILDGNTLFIFLVLFHALRYLNFKKFHFCSFHVATAEGRTAW